MTKTKDCNLYSWFKNSMLVVPCVTTPAVYWTNYGKSGVCYQYFSLFRISVYFGFIFIYLITRANNLWAKRANLTRLETYTRSGFYFSFEGSVCCWKLDGFWYQVLHVVNQSTLSLILLISPFRKCLTFFMKQSFSFASCFCLDWFRFLLKK